MVATGVLYQIAVNRVHSSHLHLLNQVGYLSLVVTLFLALVTITKLSQSTTATQWQKLNFIIDSLAILICVWSIAAVQEYDPMPNTHWEGFGQMVATASVVLALLATLTIAKGLRLANKHASLSRIFVSSVALLLVFRALPGLIQPPNALLNLNDQTYIVLEETLAQYNGFIPDVDYLRVYSSLYGWLFKIFAWIDLDKSLMMPMIVWFYNLLSLGTLLAATFIIWLSFKRRSAHSLLWIFSAIVLLASVSGEEGATTSIFSNLGWVVRFNFPFLAILCVVLVGRARRAVSRSLLSSSIGIFAAFAILNSPDYGLLFASAVLVSLVVHRVVQKRWLSNAAHITCGFLVTTALYWLSLKVWTAGFSFDKYVSLVRQAQTGSVYDEKSVAIIGPHLLMFVIALSTVIKSVCMLRKTQRASPPLNAHTLPFAALTSAMWLLFSSVKWLAAPYATGLGGGAFIQAVICGGLLIAMTQLQPGNLQTQWNIREYVRVFPLLLLLALPFAASLQTADWRVETKRLLGYANERGWANEQDRAPAGGWTKSFLLEKGTTRYPSQWLEALYKLGDNPKYRADPIVYFGSFSNTVELLSGIQSVMPTSAPEHMRFGDYFKSQACSIIDEKSTNQVIAAFGTEVPCEGLDFLGVDDSGLIGLWKKSD